MKEHMSLFDLVALTINTIIGMGIFLMPSSLLSRVNIGGFSLLSLALAFVFILFISYSYMLLGSTLRRTGGEYIYISRFLEPFFGFISVWMLNLSDLMFLVVEVKLLSSMLYSYILPHMPSVGVHIDSYTIAAMIILLFTIFALVGNKQNTKVMNFLFILLLSSISLIVIFLGIQLFSFSRIAESFNVRGITFWEIVKGAFLLMWLYFGFNVGVNVGEEIKGGERNIVRGTVISLFLVFVIYLVLEVFILSSFPLQDLIMCGDIISLFSSHGLNVLAVIANIGFAIVLITKAPSLLILLSRRFYAWGRDKILPEVFGTINQRRGVPWFSIAFSSFLTIIFLSLDINTMDFVFISTISVSVTYFLMSISALMLKYKRHRAYKRARFKVKHDTIVLIIGALLSLSLLYSVARINLFFLLFSFAWFIVGISIYVLRRDIHLIKEGVRREIEKMEERSFKV